MEGDGITPGQPSEEIENADSEYPISDNLDKLCAYWMHYGVPYDTFWNGDYTCLKYYAEAYKLDIDRKNQELWLQGMYFYDALSVVASKVADKRSQAKYPDKPYRINGLSEDEKEAEKKRMVEDFRAKLNVINNRLEAKHGRGKMNESN